MKLNPSEISNLIRSRIENFEALTEARTEGTVVSVSDGIVRIHGLSDVMQGEMLEFPGNTFGLALTSMGSNAMPMILQPPPLDVLTIPDLTNDTTLKSSSRMTLSRSPPSVPI